MTSLDEEFFLLSQQRVRALEQRLSRNALEELAREVMARLAARGPALEPDDPSHPQRADINILCQALISENPSEAREMMLDLQADGYSLDLLFARYLAPAAERLGAMWDTSELDFMQVTLGVGRIHDLVRILRDHLPATRITQKEPVLFASVPGEQHSVGLDMAAELFRQRGWDVRLLIGATHDAIMNEIENISCLVLGLSSGGRATAEALARIVHAARVAHPSIYVIVSGRIVDREPDLVNLIAPDSAVKTVEEAIATMERLSGAPTQET